MRHIGLCQALLGSGLPWYNILALGLRLEHRPPMGAVQAPLARATHSAPWRGEAGEPAPSRVRCLAWPARTPHAGAVPHLARPHTPGPRRAGTSCPPSGRRTEPGARCGGHAVRALRTGTHTNVAPAASFPDARTGRPATAPWSSWERRSPCRRHSQPCGSVPPRTSLAHAGPPSAQRRPGRPGTTPSPPQRHRQSPGLGSPMCPVRSSEPPTDGGASRQGHPPSAAAVRSHASAWVPAVSARAADRCSGYLPAAGSRGGGADAESVAPVAPPRDGTKPASPPFSATTASVDGSRSRPTVPDLQVQALLPSERVADLLALTMLQKAQAADAHLDVVAVGAPWGKPQSRSR